MVRRDTVSLCRRKLGTNLNSGRSQSLSIGCSQQKTVCSTKKDCPCWAFPALPYYKCWGHGVGRSITWLRTVSWGNNMIWARCLSFGSHKVGFEKPQKWMTHGPIRLSARILISPDELLEVGLDFGPNWWLCSLVTANLCVLDWKERKMYVLEIPGLEGVISWSQNEHLAVWYWFLMSWRRTPFGLLCRKSCWNKKKKPGLDRFCHWHVMWPRPAGLPLITLFHSFKSIGERVASSGHVAGRIEWRSVSSASNSA